MELCDTESTHKKRAEKGYIYVYIYKKKEATGQSLMFPFF